MQKEINHIAMSSSGSQEYKIDGVQVANNARVLNLIP